MYIHTNLINGKKYVGITGQNPPQKRWIRANSYFHNTHFTNSINKYGWGNFKHEIILCNLTKVEAELFEVAMIKYYKTTDSNIGYNKSNGGEGVGKHTEESKKKMSITRKKNAKPISEETRDKYRKSSSGENNPMYGRIFSEEHRVGISEGLKKHYSTNKSTFYGRKHTVENKKILSEQKRKKFICLETGIIYDSPFYACKELNIDYSYLAKACKTGKMCKGYHYKYITDDIGEQK